MCILVGASFSPALHKRVEERRGSPAVGARGHTRSRGRTSSRETNERTGPLAGGVYTCLFIGLLASWGRCCRSRSILPLGCDSHSQYGTGTCESPLNTEAAARNNTLTVASSLSCGLEVTYVCFCSDVEITVSRRESPFLDHALV